MSNNRINWPEVDTLMVDCDGNKIINRHKVQGNPNQSKYPSVVGTVYYNKHFAAFWVFADNKSYNQPLNCGNWWQVISDKEPK